MRHYFVAAFLILAGLPFPLSAALLCGGATACEVKNGNYRIQLPLDGDVRGAYVYFHGFKGSAVLQMQQKPLVDMTLAHHLAFVAVDGIGGSWAFPNSPREGRDERAFVSSVFQDLRDRYGFTPDNTILGGFSMGASMAWYTACQQGEKIAAMVTFSGVFWNPLPKPGDCVANVPSIIHFHGSSDQTFPLNGRQVVGKFHQGDAFASMAVLHDRARCNVKNTRPATLDNIRCAQVPDCIRGVHTMCIHSGGHEARAEMLDAGLIAIGFPR